MNPRKGMSPWAQGPHRVIPCGLMIAKDRDMGNCQVGNLFRGYFFRKFREFWPTKAIRSKSENGPRKNEKPGGKNLEFGQSRHRRSPRKRLVGGHREDSTGGLVGRSRGHISKGADKKEGRGRTLNQK